MDARLQHYGITAIAGDAYAGDWPADRFHRLGGITYRRAEKNRSELYLEALPMLTGQRVEFLDHPKLLAQFARLHRRNRKRCD